MHNKFAVFDARDGDETNDVVWTGSWNATYSGTNYNAENAVAVHALAEDAAPPSMVGSVAAELASQVPTWTLASSLEHDVSAAAAALTTEAAR